MACGAVAAADLESSGFDAFELGVKCKNAFDLSGGHAEILRDRTDRVVGNISFFLLNQLETLDKIPFFMPYLFQIGEVC